VFRNLAKAIGERTEDDDALHNREYLEVSVMVSDSSYGEHTVLTTMKPSSQPNTLHLIKTRTSKTPTV
jgi:hypothetical protein